MRSLKAASKSLQLKEEEIGRVAEAPQHSAMSLPDTYVIRHTRRSAYLKSHTGVASCCRCLVQCKRAKRFFFVFIDESHTNFQPTVVGRSVKMLHLSQ